jgi:hypothetical protein
LNDETWMSFSTSLMYELNHKPRAIIITHDKTNYLHTPLILLLLLTAFPLYQ